MYSSGPESNDKRAPREQSRSGVLTAGRHEHFGPAEPAAGRIQTVANRIPQPSAPLSWRGGIERLLGVRLGSLRNFRARPLRVPPAYFQSPVRKPTLVFSIVTPSYNQGRFLERTIRSVLGQGYSLLEYFIQDGGSSDESVAILSRYGDQLSYWESRKDRGQSHALNRGFARSNGDVLAFLNSDDVLLPGALHYVADYLSAHADVDVVYGHRIIIDEDDREVDRCILPRHDNNVLTWADFIPQETLFWRRRMWEKVGGRVDESFQFALDWDLLLRFRDAGARFVRLPRFLGAFRLHDRQKTATLIEQYCVPETQRLYDRYGIKEHHRSGIYRYRNLFPFLLRHAFYQRMHQVGLLRY
jgi:glycosyltransferase involved in cell wall biosynthesis